MHKLSRFLLIKERRKAPAFRHGDISRALAVVFVLDFVSTVGGAPLAVIKQYVENQKNV